MLTVYVCYSTESSTHVILPTKPPGFDSLQVTRIELPVGIPAKVFCETVLALCVTVQNAGIAGQAAAFEVSI
jgi:hypothetical protein